MKTLIILAYIILNFGFSVLAQDTLLNKKLIIKPADTVNVDSVEYELIIIDPGFDLWLASVAKPMGYYSKEYLESWNQQYVLEWNNRYLTGQDPYIIESMIDFQPGMDYGIEVNYQLYEYFQYVETEHHLKLLNRAGH